MSVQSATFCLSHTRRTCITMNDLTHCNVRQTDMSDLQVLETLITPYTKLFFGNIEYADVLHKSNISMCIESVDCEAVAFLCLEDHPNIPSIPPWEWSHWLYNIYHLETITPRNSLWVHLAVWNNAYRYTFMQPLLRAVFSSNHYLEYILLVIPPGITKTDWLKNLGTRIVPSGFANSYKVQTLYLIVRQHFVTKYKIRRAVEEDNDDIVPLIHKYSDRLQKHYGEFYIAEMLTRHPDAGRQIIVAENNEHAVAVLCLNESVNFALLNEAFELIPFYGLMKNHEDDAFVNKEPTTQTSHADLMVYEDIEEGELPLSILEPNCEYLAARDSIGSFESEEVEIKSSNDSLDDFEIVNVSSVHFDMDASSAENFPVGTRSSNDFSAMILSFNEYEMHLFADRSALKSVSFDDLPHHSSRILKPSAYVPMIPVFHGDFNAFTLELAASHPGDEVEALALLLEAAFECFPNRDYCVLSVPSTCPPFPLLNHFARVVPRPVTTYPHELYVLHRNVVLGHMSVRIAVRTDIPEIEELISRMLKVETLYSNFVSAVNEDDDYRAFVLLSQNQIVGVAVVKREEDVDYLKSHYELSYWVDEFIHKSDSHGLLQHLVLSPIFQRHSRFFLREIHRLSNFSILYYCIFPSDVATSLRERPLCCVMGDLIAIRPRPKVEFSHTNLEGCTPADVVHRTDAPFALYLSTARHCTLPRYEINKKIVVVGISDTALAFLDSLLTNWSTTFYVALTNVTVVSPQGLPYQKPTNRVRDMMFPTRSHFNYHHMHLTSLRTYVNVVNAVMTGIDRKNKLLIVNDYNYLAYDYLFLMCGKQFQKPSVSSIQKEKQKKGKEFPENVFLINSEADSTNALVKLKTLAMQRPKQPYMIIMYGHSLETYCCLAALLEYGVPGTNITFVESFPIISENNFYHSVSDFNDGDIDAAVQAAIISEEMTVYHSYYFSEWAYDQDSNRITGATFESRNKKVSIDCIAMFMYNDKTVSVRTFLAINQAGLVFDGGLVVGPDCRTNDPNIYAAGTITKYSRRYYADHMAHKYYNLEEIGSKLGQQIRKKLLSFSSEEENTNPVKCDSGNMLVPSYSKPLMTYCHLPGNLRYLKVTKPGKQVPLEVAMSADDYGQVLVTGDCTQIDKQGFFRLHLNQYGAVETITCLAKFEIDRINLTSLWGKHEKLLNNLQTRFEMVLITDLFEYFKEPWCCAIYHDRFPLLEQSIKELLTSYASVVGESPLEDLMRMFKENDWNKLSLDQKEDLEEKFMGSPYHKLLEQQVLDFLRDNDTFLPMYAHPTIVSVLLQGFENSPLFEPQ